jgi:hypothetical protein
MWGSALGRRRQIATPSPQPSPRTRGEGGSRVTIPAGCGTLWSSLEAWFANSEARLRGRSEPLPAKLRPSSIESPRTADKQIAPKVEPQQTVGRARNADPFATPDFPAPLAVRSEPQRADLTKVDPV